MAFDPLLLAINLLTGGMVGYVTNALAIRMLFREYPIIGGGEVIKDREHLEEAMSQLVEEQLITPETLLSEFDKPAFKQSFEQLVKQIIAHHLKNQLLRFETPADLKGYNQTLANLKHFLRSKREYVLDILLKSLFQHVLVKDVLSPAQLAYILEIFWQRLLETLGTHHGEIAEQLQQTLRSVDLDQLLDAESLRPLLEKWMESFVAGKAFSQLETLVDGLAEHLELEVLLDKLELHLRQRNLAELLGAFVHEQQAQSLALRLLKFLNTPRGEQLLEELLRHAFQVAKKLDLPLGVLLNQTLEWRLLELLQTYLPPLLGRFESWAEANRQELEGLVQAAVQDHLRSENLLKHLTATLFSDQISARYHIIENVLAEIKLIASQSMPELLEMVNRFVENTTLGRVASYLEQHLVDYTALTRTLLRLLNTYLPRLDLSLLDPLLTRPLDQFSLLKDLHLAELWQKYVFVYIKGQLQTRWLIEAAPFLSQIGLNIWERIAHQPLSAFLPGDELQNVVEHLLPLLQSEPLKPWVLEKLKTTVPELLAERPLESLLSPRVRQALRTALGQLYEHRLDAFLDSFEQEKMEGLYLQLSEAFLNLVQHEVVAEEVREVLVGFMIELIREHQLFEGRIYQVVKESFSRFSDQEMQAEMEGFMGKELQPITLLGAVLGAGVGGLLSVLELVPGAGLLTTSYGALLFYPICYALTGVGTNWLAIRMLFRPYDAKFWPGSQQTLPFTPGVFVKNKAALAESMGRFIDQKLLSRQNMVGILDRYHHRWKEVIRSVVSQNNYAAWDQRLRQVTRQSYDRLTPLLLQLGFQQVYRFRSDIAASLIQNAKEIRWQAADLQLLHEEIQQGFLESQPRLIQFLNKKLTDLWQAPYALADLLSPGQSQWLFAQVKRGVSQGVDWLLKQLEQPQLLKQQLVALAPEGLLNLQLESLTPGQSLPKAEVVAFLLDWIQGESLQAEIRQLLERYLEELLGSGKTLGELWDGKVLWLLRQESDTLIDIMAGYLLELARQNKERIAKAVSADVQRQGLLEVMLVNFGGVRQDVYRVVDVIVEYKLADYLATKTEGLKQWWHQLLSQELPQVSLDQLGLMASHFEIHTLQRILQEDILQNPQTASLLTELADGIVDELLRQLDLNALLQSLQLTSVQAVVERFESELELCQEHLSAQLMQQRQPIEQVLERFTSELLTQLVTEQPLRFWLSELSLQTFKQRTQYLLVHFYQSPLFESLLPKLTSQLLEPLQAGDISQLISYQQLERDTLQTLEQLTFSSAQRSQAFQTAVQDALKDFAIEFVDVLNLQIEQETKLDLEELAVDSLIDGLRTHNREILEPVDFEQIVHRQVMKMTPQRIEALFDFAQHIFRALILYGAMGGVIGIAAGLLAAFGE